MEQKRASKETETSSFSRIAGLTIEDWTLD
jgi:hypothetical protein